MPHINTQTNAAREAGHTPGPWNYYPDNHGEGIADSNGVTIAVCRRYTDHTEEAIANAYLIASAPDLLEAMKIIAGQAQLTSKTFPNAPGIADWQQVERIARAAIDKAKGVA